MVAAFCAWILTLPVFPSQDGPMHRYYVHVLAQVLNHNPRYNLYSIRHPFPPYATHYLSLLLLYKLFSYDVAEKVFTCGLVICFGYGFRFCAMAIGPLGDAVSLCIAPLFLHWAVMMGFFNYDLALAFFLFAIGFWLRAVAGSRWWWVGYAAMVAILAVTHPVPLLVLIGLFLVHLVLTLLRPAAAASGTFLQRHGWQLAALAFACAAFLYPAASLDRSRSASTLHDMRLHQEFVRTALLLTGVSPYNTRSASLLINLYRLSLYAMLAVALVFAARAFAAKWRERRLTLGDSLFASTLLLLVGLPVLPDTVNGSYYFATRLVVLVWVGAMLAASGYQPRRSLLQTGDRRVFFTSAAGIFLAVLSLVTAEVYVRPVARAVYAVEQQPLPEHGRAILLVGKGLDTWSRFGTQLAPDFFEWGQILPLVRRQDVALDTPWLEQNILPLQAVPGGSLFVGDIRHSPFLNPAMTAPGAVPDAEVEKVVSAADFILYAGAPADLATGVSPRLPEGDAARFACTSHGWYLLCPRR
jgi:hypothetical protein